MRKPLVLALVWVIFLSANVSSQARRRSTQKRSARPATTAKVSSDLLAGRNRVAAQIKTMTQFLYLFGGVVKGFESVDQATGNEALSPAAIEQNKRNKAKVKDSIRNVRDGLDKLETDFRFNSALSRYYPRLSGVARVSEMAENQAIANRFDEAGRSLLKVVDQLADTLAAMR